MQDTAPDLAPDFTPGAEEFSDLSLAQDLRLLAQEAKTFAQAELAFQKSRAAYVGKETRNIVILLVIAAVLVFFAVMAFVVGTVIALGPLLGLWGAMAAVTVSLLLMAAFGAWNARSRLKLMLRVAGGSQSD